MSCDETDPDLIHIHWSRVLYRDLLTPEPEPHPKELPARLEIPTMSKLLSRILLSTEAILISLPLTAFFITEKLPMQWHRALDHPTPATWLSAAACVVLIAYAACVWRLIVAFSMDGSAALQRLFATWWYAPHAAAAVALAVLMFLSASFAIDPTWLREFAWALPMAVPSAHLGLEYLLRPVSRPKAAAPVASRSGGRPGVSLRLVR